jgi:tripeptide aminopeptidase
MAARAAATMPCGRVDDESTANVGTIQGGTATNVVAQTAVVTGECRSLDPERVEEIRQRMQRAMEDAAEALEGRVEVVWTEEYQAFHFADDDPVVGLVEAACRDIGIEPRRIKTMGGSDGNILHAKGVPTLVLASGMRSVHGVDEWMRVEDLSTLARLTEAVVRRSVD